MYVTESNVYDMLAGISHKPCLRQGASFRLERMHLLVPGEVPDDPAVLYFCDTQSLPQEAPPDDANVLLVFVGPPAKARDCAKKLRLSIIAVTDDISVIAVFNRIQDEFSALMRWSLRVNGYIASGRDMKSLITLSCDIFGENPMMLVNASYNILACSVDKIEGSDKLKETLETGYFSQDVTDALYRIGYQQNSQRLKTPTVYDPPNYMNVPFIIVTLYQGHLFHGFLVLYFTDGHHPTPGEIELFTFFSKKVFAYYLRSLNTGKGAPSQKEAFFSDLLMHTYEDEAYLIDRAKFLRIPLDNDYRVCVIEWRDYSRSQAEYLLWRIRQDGTLPYFRMLIYEETLVILLNGDLSGVGIHEKMNYSFKPFTDLLDVGDGRAGLSLPHFPLMKISVAYRQAISAIRMGLRLAPDEKMYFYSQFYVYELLSDYEKRYALEDVYVKRIETLKDTVGDAYDNYHLLRTFLLMERNISLTARIMHMHRNSVIYRLNKIQETLGVNLDNPDVRLRLMLTFKIMELKSGSLPDPLPLKGGQAEEETVVYFE